MELALFLSFSKVNFLNFSKVSMEVERDKKEEEKERRKEECGADRHGHRGWEAGAR